MWYFQSKLAQIQGDQSVDFTEVPEGLEVFMVAQLSHHLPQILYIVRDETRLALVTEQLKLLCLTPQILSLPGWDCLPYDRSSPTQEVLGCRATVLEALSHDPETPRILLTSVSSFLQKVPPRKTFQQKGFQFQKEKAFSLSDFQTFMQEKGYTRVITVRALGDYAIRGGILDVFPPEGSFPFRLELFGDTVEQIKTFDPLTQRSLTEVSEITLGSLSEVILTPQTIQNFREGYRSIFGKNGEKDPLYQGVSCGQTQRGMEHWLPLFYPTLETLLDYAPSFFLVVDSHFQEAVVGRLQSIQEAYDARKKILESPLHSLEDPYLPLPPANLYVPMPALEQLLAKQKIGSFKRFQDPGSSQRIQVTCQGKVILPGLTKKTPKGQKNALEAARSYLTQSGDTQSPTFIACQSAASRERLKKIFQEHDFPDFALWDQPLWTFPAFQNSKKLWLIVFPLDHSFVTQKSSFASDSYPGFCIISEQEILGESHRLVFRRRRRADVFLRDLGSLEPGDFLVHTDHGIGQYQGLKTLSINAKSHDFLCLLYEGEAKLFVPVENLDILSRYGGDTSAAALDKLGSVSWQSRKAKIKEDLLQLANHLMEIAAARHLLSGEKFEYHEGLYEEFCAHFPYTETEDQLRVIQEVLEDLRSGKPMDRLVCGDVGFGKTEVALRAAFVVACAGRQVVLITPTTLLSRQHFLNFRSRLHPMNLRVEELSRLRSPSALKRIKDDLKAGKIDVLVSTQSVLSASVEFAHLGLLIIDEEQHFGVKQKERLKERFPHVHVLSMTATPIPRTMQMALTGVKDLSLIATPPVDRLAVKTFITPFDRVMMREAILREYKRGGQVFCVTPRIKDMEDLALLLQELVPEVTCAVVHGQMGSGSLEKVMSDFCAHKYDLLLSTNIIESGLDLTSVNTLIVHRSDLFGLAQLYQLRGRVGRGSAQGYAYFTLPARGPLSSAAQKRLEVIQTLDTLGTGFQLASYDMDIRGAGNLLGKQQSGHIREVGAELYQQMLEEAIDKIQKEKIPQGKDSDFKEQPLKSDWVDRSWTPQLNLGLPVLIPEEYVPDLSVRLNLYRRLSFVSKEEEIEEIRLEFEDRFGRLPLEVLNLLQVIQLKTLCRKAHIEKFDAGEKGATFSFHQKTFPNPDGLIAYIQEQKELIRIRPDQSLVVLRNWKTPQDRTQGAADLLRHLGSLAEAASFKL